MDQGAKRKIDKANARIEGDRLRIEKLESDLARLETAAGVHGYEQSMSRHDPAAELVNFRAGWWWREVKNHD